MSRSIPTNNDPNPCVLWIEWDGANGTLRHYDKEKKENIDDGDRFTFILLDQLACVKGWHDASESGIFSNEVRDTRAEPMVVKAFKGGEIASGIYKDIRDRVNANGGHFVASLYVGCKSGDGLTLGNLQFKGAALREFMEFAKNHRADLYKKAIAINGSKEGKKGKVVFKTPVFSIKDISPETDQQALALDTELQEYLKGYFKRTSTARADASIHQPDAPDDVPEYREDTTDHAPQENFDDQDIPF